ncbi:MAG: flagellar biosynthetic protein FliR [endosymbiont of Galathealinum brachiosum]|uniref:Flagellar biosynthetic protein FliR n=1 Tax=endosymbiont of Galathealinum brachiosum TaxID=2200906 RepID=A0A370D8C0_9GAMM|nr:MAG: flagellar biosynthetic protein FliR [endosymbiont of Galathealinum brachiosum]
MLVLTTEQIAIWLGSFFWPFVRIGAMMMAAPVFGARMMPVRIRITMAVAVSFLTVPLIPQVPAVDPISFSAAGILFHQILIGVATGLIIQMVFQSLVIAGEAIANGMGLGFARMVDPANGVQVPVISQFFVVMATLLFVILNGHLLLIQLMVRSFEILPIAETGLSLPAMKAVANWASQMFVGGLMVALPAVTALLVVNISMGVITRAAPQLNIFAVGFPLMILLGFIFLAATLPSVFSLFTQMLMDSFESITEIMEMR